MPARREQASLRQREEVRSGVALAIYHVSQDFERHVAALRRSSRFRVTCQPQRKSSRVSVKGIDGVLWELAPGKKPDRRRLASLARGVPVVSYSATGGRKAAAVSRAAGFTSHLKAPLRPAEVARALGAAPRPDLAARLKPLQRALGRRFRRADVLAELVRATLVPVEPARVADALVSRLVGWLPVLTWAVVTVDHEGTTGLLGRRFVTDELEQVVQAIGLWVMKRGEPFASASLAVDPRVGPAGEAGGAALAFPLTSRGRTVAALVAVDRQPASREPRLSVGTAAALAAVLEPAALAFDNALRAERAEALSVTDDLTQLYNSRYLAQVLRRESKRASRSGRPLSLLFIDLDGFKGVNDVHGHLCGSRTLVEVAAVIKASARETDVVSRFGGDEFAAVLPDTGSEGAVAVGERIRDRIAEYRFLTGEGLNIALTASVGVATLPDVAASADGLMRAADRAMYWVKDHGKNGISVYTS
jgi:diguanylate cyclase (GGDEF)-like protein